MNSASDQSALVCSVDGKKRSGLSAALRASVWIVPAVAFVIWVLLFTVQRSRLSELGVKFLISLVYTALIAPPSAVLLNSISIRFSERFPRLIFPLNALALLLTATTGTFAALLVLRVVGLVRPDDYWRAFLGSYPFSIVVTLIVGFSISSFETLRHRLQAATLELRTRQMEQERANALLAEARLSSLESRIHPHFLFNTLNSIASLIPSDPRRAEDTVGKLASLLRFSLSANQSSLVPLAQELKIVRDYLEIESTRFGSRLRYRIDIPESIVACKVPPLALQTLVENSVRHVAAERAEGAAIQIAGSIANGTVQLEVIDDGSGFSLVSISPEHGLGNLSARLNLLFGERGQLDVERRDGKTVARISFPAES